MQRVPGFNVPAPCENSDQDTSNKKRPFFSSKGRARASLPGSLAASDALGSARSGFEATPVVDADHGVSES